MTAWDVYWVMQADSVRWSFAAIAVLLGIVTLSTAFCAADEDEPEDVRASSNRISWMALFGLFVVAVCGMMYPTTKTMAAMYVLPKLANNEQLQQDAGDVYELAIQAIKEQLQTKGESHED